MIALMVVAVVAAIAVIVRVVVAIRQNRRAEHLSDGWRDEHERGRRDA